MMRIGTYTHNVTRTDGNKREYTTQETDTFSIDDKGYIREEDSLVKDRGHIEPDGDVIGRSGVSVGKVSPDGTIKAKWFKGKFTAHVQDDGSIIKDGWFGRKVWLGKVNDGGGNTTKQEKGAISLLF